MSKDCKLMNHPFRVVISDLDVDEAGLCCPFCGDTYLHPAKVTVEQGRTKTTVQRELTYVEPTDRGKALRGSEISLVFWCESGHRFEYRMAFHKGQLLCELLAYPDAEPAPDDELWRN